MEEQRLSFALMLSYLNRVLEGVEDPRQRSNARRYHLRDLVLGSKNKFGTSSGRFSRSMSINGG